MDADGKRRAFAAGSAFNSYGKSALYKFMEKGLDSGKKRRLAFSFLKFLLLSGKEYTKMRLNNSGNLLKKCALSNGISEELTIIFLGLNGNGKVYKLNR